jgi:nicotinamidase/pyrazinamidase
MPDESTVATTPAFRNVIFWDVDTQFDFMRPEGRLHVPDAESLDDNLARLTEFARRHRIPIVASADDHELEDEEISLEPDFARTWPPHCMRGTSGAARIPATRLEWSLEAGHEALPRQRIEAATSVEQPRILIHKKTVDVFSNPNADSVVNALDPHRVVVYGVALDVCNRMAVEGLLERGRRVTVVTDAVRAIDAAEGDRLLDAWERRGVELLTTEELLDSLAS